MNNLALKKIKFFKSKEVPKKRMPNNKPPTNKESKPKLLEQLIKNPFFYLFLFVLVITYFTAYIPSRSILPLEAGEIAPFDVEVPLDITLEDTEATDEKRREALAAVLPVYNLDKNIFSYTEEKIRTLFQSGRELIKAPLTENI